MGGEETLEGWMPQIGRELPLSRVIDLAFDYRGNTTVVKTDGREMHGYIFNRNADVAAPFIEMFDAEGGGPHTVLYNEIRTIKFIGKDMAAGRSYAAWLERRRREQSPEDRAGAPAPHRATL